MNPLEWRHKKCGGQLKEIESEKFGCTKCKRNWYADFNIYLANIVFEKIGL